MAKIIVTIITFLFSSFSILNVEQLPQSEELNEENRNQSISKAVDIPQEYIIEDVQPEKVVSKSNSESSSSDWWDYPKDIKEATREGNDLLVLVNKEYKLHSSYAPSDLVRVGENVIRRGSSYYLRSIIIEDLKELVDDAQNDGLDLSVVSAYRSYSTQANTYQYWVNYNGGCVSCADRISARAGHSQHQLGTTLDFSSSEINDALGIKFGDTNASAWLKENAYKYGFVLSFPQGYETITGFSYEPWHYRYIGKANAQEMINSGMILEEYLRSKN
jgi:D-alanyl-D-alanine carboxypeptidase